MKSEDLDKILVVVADYMNVTKSSIAQPGDSRSAFAHDVVCHLLAEGFPHLVPDFAEMAKTSVVSVYHASERIDADIACDALTRKRINSFRRLLGIPAIRGKRAAKAHRGRCSATMLLFGFDWTDSETMLMSDACESAARYMLEEYGQGLQPLKDGYAVTRKNKYN